MYSMLGPTLLTLSLQVGGASVGSMGSVFAARSFGYLLGSGITDNILDLALDCDESTRARRFSFSGICLSSVLAEPAYREFLTSELSPQNSTPTHGTTLYTITRAPCEAI